MNVAGFNPVTVMKNTFRNHPSGRRLGIFGLSHAWLKATLAAQAKTFASDSTAAAVGVSCGDHDVVVQDCTLPLIGNHTFALIGSGAS